MKAFIEGTLKMVEDASFKDKATGSLVPYFVSYIQDDESKLLKVGSRENHTPMVGRDCVFVIGMKPDYEKPNLYKLSLLDIKPQK